MFKLVVQFIIGVVVGLYGYLMPSFITLSILQLSSANRLKDLWKAIIIISLVEIPYCYFCMSGMQWIMQQSIILLIIKWLIVVVLFVFAYLSWKQAKTQNETEQEQKKGNNSLNSLLTIAIFNPFQLSSWAIWGSYFVEKSYFTWNPLSIFIFSIGASAGVFLILRAYAFAGKKLINYFKVNKSKIDYMVAGILATLAIVQLIRNILD